MAPPPLAAAATGDDSVAFEEAAERAGLLFKFENGQTPEHQLPETMSGGVALIDFDQDGWIDVYVVQGGPFPPPGETRNNDRLFRNLGDGTFQDVSTSTGIAGFVGGYGHGVTVGDVDRNGFSDLVVTRWRDVRLYLNRGDGTFADASEDWGLGHDAGWPTSAALADLDGDGDLDLYVCEYCEWDTAHPRVCRGTDGIQSNYCPPSLLPALPDRLFRNEGNRFVDVSKFSGIAAADAEGRGLGVVAADLDGDRRLDLFVANDTTANFFFRNLGDMHFEECALARGLASNAEGGYLAGMGVACGDFDADGRTDLAVTNYYGECTTYYRNLGEGLFADRTAEIGLSAPTRDRLGFGVYFSDMNNDGLLDIVQVNGHAGDFRPAYPYAMPAQLLLQRGDGRVAEPRPRTGDPWRVLRVGRGLAIGDLDNDGMLDALIVDQLGPLSYLHNRTTHVQRHSVSVELRGTRSGLDAVGAVVTVTCSGRQQSFQRLGGGSYQSASDTRLHFGLAGASTIDSLEVRWPAGTKAIYHNLEPDTRYRVTEGAAAPEKLGPLVSSQSR
jgi:hypothetical protein